MQQWRFSKLVYLFLTAQKQKSKQKKLLTKFVLFITGYLTLDTVWLDTNLHLDIMFRLVSNPMFIPLQVYSCLKTFIRTHKASLSQFFDQLLSCMKYMWVSLFIPFFYSYIRSASCDYVCYGLASNILSIQEVGWQCSCLVMPFVLQCRLQYHSTLY